MTRDEMQRLVDSINGNFVRPFIDVPVRAWISDLRDGSLSLHLKIGRRDVQWHADMTMVGAGTELCKPMPDMDLPLEG